MDHARLRAALLCCVVTLASACGPQQSAGRASTVAGERRVADTASGSVSPAADRSDEPELTPASGTLVARGDGGECPMALAGARLTTLPTLGGTAFVFTTARESARDELRRRVLALRDAYAGAVAAPEDAAGLAASRQIAVHADYLDEPGGARLEIRAARSSDAERLRRSLRADATAMQDTQRCPVLEGAATDSTP
jgi:hypothetical protein